MIVDTMLTGPAIQELFGNIVRDALRKLPAVIVYDQPSYYAILATKSEVPARFRTYRIEASLVTKWEKWTECQLLRTPGRFHVLNGRDFLVTITNAGWLEGTAEERKFADLVRLLLLPDRMPEPERLPTR